MEIEREGQWVMRVRTTQADRDRQADTGEEGAGLRKVSPSCLLWTGADTRDILMDGATTVSFSTAL